MLIDTPKAYKRPNFSLCLENNSRHRSCRTSIDTVDIGRICLVILTQNKAEVNIWAVEMFSIYKFLLDHRNLQLNVICGVKVFYLVYVLTRRDLFVAYEKQISWTPQGDKWPRHLYWFTYAYI